MATMDIFNNDAFSLVSLTSALERVPYKPQLLGQLNIFTPKPIRTTTFAVENRSGLLSVIPTTPRGAPVPQAPKDSRSVRAFSTVRLAFGDRLNASEIEGIRAFGSENEFVQVQKEVLARMAKLRGDLDLTWERHRLGAIQGIVLDADGSVLYDWFDAWDIAQPSEVNFELDKDTTDLRGKCRQMTRAMQKAAKGAWAPGTSVVALCGDEFFDMLVNHPAYKETKLNTERAVLLEDIKGYSSVEFAGITFINYRGTDDDSTIAIGSQKAKFFPVNAPGVFEHVMSPGETFDTVNTLGKPYYAMQVPDRDRNMFVDLEVYSYPAFICTRPEMLLRAKAK